MTTASAHDWNQRGLAAYEAADFDQAADWFEKAVEAAPDWAVAHDNLGLALLHLGQLMPAMQCHLKAIELDPGCASAHYNLAALLQESGDLLIEAEYETALDLDPDHGEAEVGLAKLHYDRGEFPKALALFKRAIQRNVHDLDAYNHLGLCYASLGDFAKARKYWLKAASLDVNDYFAHLNLAALYATDFATDRALNHLERALSIDPRRGLDDLLGMPQFDDLRHDPRCQRLVRAHRSFEVGAPDEADPTRLQ